MAQWRDRRAVFLDELLRTEGRGYHRQQTRCATCATDVAKAIFRCRDCFTDALFCKACLVSIHRDNPLHRVEVSASLLTPWVMLISAFHSAGETVLSLRPSI
jgi:hypothetical protein